MIVPVQTSVQPEHQNATLWRFMDFTKYVAMLHRRALFFTRADELPDPFEGTHGRTNRRVQRHRAENERRLRQRVCLSCWHQNEHRVRGDVANIPER